MSIFTTTTDHALNRFTLPDGTTVAVGYDLDATDPLEDEFIGHVAAERVTSRQSYISSGATELISQYEEWNARAGELDQQREEGELTAAEYVAELADLGPLTIERHEYTAYNLWGHPTFAAYIDRQGVQEAIGEGGDVDKVVQGVLTDYAQWAEGEMYLLEIEHPDGTTDYIGGIIEDVTAENVNQYI